jgi:ABC-2 type transport system permease protein
MKAASKYAWIGYTSARSNLAYAGEMVVRTAFMGVILYIFARLWRAVYAEAGAERLDGFTLQQMIWYLAMTEAIVLSTPRVSIEVDQDVRTGRVAVELLRPLSYALYRFGHYAGERCVRFLINSLAGAVAATLLVGAPRFTPHGLAMFVLVLPLAFVLDFLAYFAIGLCAFWLENTAGLTLIYSRTNMIFGGILLPIDMFPPLLEPVVRILPFASAVYAPARMFAAPDTGMFPEIVLRQLLSVAVFAAVAAAVQRVALKKLQANGG